LKTPLVEETVLYERRFGKVFLKGLRLLLLFNSMGSKANIIKSEILLVFHYIGVA